MNGTDLKHPKLSSHALAVYATILAIGTALALIYLMPPLPPVPQPDILPFPYHDTTWQRWGHRIMLILLALAGLSGPWLARSAWRVLGRAGVDAANALALRTPLLLLVAPFSIWYFRFHMKTGRDPSLLGMGMLLLGWVAASRWSHLRSLRMALGLALAGYVAAVLVPGLFGSFIFENGLGGLGSISNHLYGLVAHSPLLAQGFPIMENVRSFYGLLPQTLFAIVQHRAGVVFQLGDYITIVQSFQIIFALLTLVTYRMYAPERPIGALLCLALFVPWIGTAMNSMSVVMPTASGLRFMNFPAAVFVLLLVRRSSARTQGFTAGFATLLALVNNLETGICVALAFGANQLVSERAGDFRAVAARLWFLLLGALAAALAYMAIFRLGLGHWPSVRFSALFDYISLNARGFTGFPWSFSFIFFVAITLPSYMIVRLTNAWLYAGLSFRMRFKFFVCFVQLVWAAFYFTKPWLWNLWPYLALLTYLVVDLFPTGRALRIGWRELFSPQRRKVLAMGVLTVFALAPESVNWGFVEGKKELRSVAAQISVDKNPGAREKLGGVWLNRDCARELLTQRDFIAQAANQGRKIFFSTPQQFYMQLLTGVFFHLPMQHLSLESLTQEMLEQNMEALKASKPDLVLLSMRQDLCDGVPDQQIRFSRYVVDELGPGYAPTGYLGSALVLERVGGAASTPETRP